MFFVLYVLHDDEKLKAVLDAWQGSGVSGVTILPSTGIGRIRDHFALREDVPLIPSLKSLLEEHEDLLNRTLFTVVDDEAMVDRVVAATEKVVGRLDSPNTGILVVLPVLRVYGLHREKNSSAL